MIVSGTGVGAIVGVPATAAAMVAVAEGAAMATTGITMMASGGSKARDSWAASQSAGSRDKTGGPFSGDIKASPEKYDPDAHALAERIGGEPQVYFADDVKARPFDVVSDRYIAQAKPANYSFNAAGRNQAKATFQAAAETGRTPYFHFDGPPHPSVRTTLEEYGQRWGIEYVIDDKPL